MDCIFCKIANGEIPSATIYEDDEFRAILDLGPSRKGHTLILPKKHYADLFDMPDETAKTVLPTAKKIAAALVKATNATGVQLIQNNGESAGQTVFHFHLHLIPGYDELGPGATWIPGEIAEADKTEIPENVKKYL